MSIASCILQAKKWVKENSEVEFNARELESVGRLLAKAEELGASPSEREALMSQLVDQKLAVDQARRRASNYLDAVSIEKGKSTTLGMFKKWTEEGADPKKAAVESFLGRIRGGASRIGEGGNLDPLHMEATLRTQYHTMLRQALGPEDEKLLMASKPTDRLEKDIHSELDAIKNKLQLGQTNNDAALRIAKALRPVQDITLKDIQAVNPFYGDNPDYLLPRNHNRDLILADPSATGREAWIKQAMKNFSASFYGMPEGDRVKAFGDIYDQIKSGTYGGDTFDPESFWKKPIPAGNRARAMAGTRTLVAASAQDEAEYAAKYGDGIWKAISRDLDYKASNIAKLQKWGPNASANFEAEYRAVLKALPAGDAQEAFKQAYPKFKDALEVTMGRQQNVAYGMAARLTQNALAVQNLTKLGAHVPRSLNGLQTAVTLMRDGTGRTFFQNTTDLAQHLGGALVSMDGGREGAQMLGVGLRDFSRELAGDMARGQTAPGMISKAGEALGKLSLADRYTTAAKFATARMHAEWLGHVADTEFAALPPPTQNLLTRYGITEPRWNALREGVGQEGPTKGLITPESVRNIPDETIKKVLVAEKGTPTNPREYDRVRLEMATQLGTLYNDVASLSGGESNTRSRIAAYGNTSINNGMGMARRLMMQFKQHAFVQQQIFERTFRSGADSTGNVGGLATHILGAAFLSAVGEGIVTIAAGKTLPSPFSNEMIGRALMGSGGLGVYGDAVVHSLQGKNPSAEKLMLAGDILGPTFGTATKIGVATQRTLQGIGQSFQGRETPGQFGGKYWAQTLHDLTPQQNLFYAKGAIDYIFFNKLHEFMGDKGYMESLRQHLHDTPGWPEALGGTGGHQQFTFGGQTWR